MTAILRASVSLDGKLLGAAGRPLLRPIPLSRIREARELLLTIHPVITGGDAVPSLSGLPGAFLPAGTRWDLLSAASGRAGTILARYRNRRFKAKRV